MGVVIEVPALDAEAMAAARARQKQLLTPAGALGRLEELAVWAAGAQGNCPPRRFARPVVVVIAGDHGVAAAEVSAYPSEATAQMVASMVAGSAAVNVLADLQGAWVRVADLSVDGETPPLVNGGRIRRGSRRIDQEDALTAEETELAIAAGRRIADEEVDAGADLLIIGDVGIGNTTPAAVLAAALTGAEPIKAVGRGSGIDDATWMRKVSAVRDALRRATPVRNNAELLLQTAGGADLAATVGFLVQAAVRRTPVLLDGLVSCVCGLLAELMAPGASVWWVAATRSPEPAQRLALEGLGLEPLLDLGLRHGEGTGALLALPLLQAAVATLAAIPTFAEAGLTGSSGPAAGPSTDPAPPFAPPGSVPWVDPGPEPALVALPEGP